MSANISEQSREISIMLGLGFSKLMLIKLYIYEAMILVISSSLSGFMIGVLIGNLMVLQHCTFEHFPFYWTAPVHQIGELLGLSVVCAVGSTLGSVRAKLRLSIPDIQRSI